MTGQSKSRRVCKVSDCDNTHSSGGYCNLHYQRMISGKPLDWERKTLRERISSKSLICGDGCVVWTGAVSGGNRKGGDQYGYIRVQGKTKRVHRVVYEELNGAIRRKKIIMHTCDNTLCVNPDHLVLGTQRDNMRDMIKKGRDFHPSKLRKTNS